MQPRCVSGKAAQRAALRADFVRLGGRGGSFPNAPRNPFRPLLGSSRISLPQSFPPKPNSCNPNRFPFPSLLTGMVGMGGMGGSGGRELAVHSGQFTVKSGGRGPRLALSRLLTPVKTGKCRLRLAGNWFPLPLCFSAFSVVPLSLACLVSPGSQDVVDDAPLRRWATSQVTTTGGADHFVLILIFLLILIFVPDGPREGEGQGGGAKSREARDKSGAEGAGNGRQFTVDSEEGENRGQAGGFTGNWFPISPLPAFRIPPLPISSKPGTVCLAGRVRGTW